MTTPKKRVIRNARVALVHCRPYWAAIGLIEPEEQVGAGHYLLFGQNITRDAYVLNANPVCIDCVTINRPRPVVSVDELPHLAIFVDTEMC